MDSDHYKTLAIPSGESLYKIKNSKFFSYSYPVTSETEIKEILVQIKKEHYQARHWCYAWRLGTSTIRYRANDDGEPSNTAGQPILGQIQSYELTNTLVVVVRYFGGVKLGVGGLISAYRTAAQESLSNATIVTKLITKTIHIEFEYPLINEVMRKIKQHKLIIGKKDFNNNCQIWIESPKSDTKKNILLLTSIYGVSIHKKNEDSI
ncbi:IMPACT family protein [Aquimarina agarivorans]|uniref:IMPACT family protein n=1 Tax=Aquimarina agarivorans TaxID=980584 RepID=UPI000248E5C5|nr:YigZ family protein [Aquimarina agarivorans]